MSELTEWVRPPASLSLRQRIDDDADALTRGMSPVTLPDGSSVRVLDRGHGEAIVFVPMLTEMNFTYAPQIAEFQASHRVILWEPRLSATNWITLEDRVREIRGVLSALDVPSAHFVAWGDAGSAVYLLAKEHPELCRSLVFIGLADRYRFPQPYELLLTMLVRLPIERVFPARVFADILGRMVGGTQLKPEWITERAAVVPRVTALFKYSITPNLRDHHPVAGEVRVPSLLINGDHDNIVSAAQAQRMAALLPGAGEAIIRPGGDHFVNYIDDEFANEAISRFYSSLA